ncbi:hypothetical protein [Acidithiobacillus thiooxidans]|nr:hypothetical protein [Acidithiobacillus thiooxidans]
MVFMARRTSVALLAAFCLSCGPASWADSFLTPGVIGSNCGSFLTPGQMTACLKKKKAIQLKEKKIKPKATLATREKSFYKNYGKPPKAAATALLDPTPSHIKAWALEEIRQQDNAAEVAAALTREEESLEKQKQKIPAALALAAKIPNYYGDGMHVVLWGETPKLCPGCAEEEQVIQAIATENPNITVSENLVGAGSLQDAIRYAANSWFDFNVNPESIKNAEKMGVNRVPTLVITDGEYHKTIKIGGETGIKSLRNDIIDLRKQDIGQVENTR